MDDKQAPLAISPEELEQLKQIFSVSERCATPFAN